jgi:hypothetical protein
MKTKKSEFEAYESACRLALDIYRRDNPNRKKGEIFTPERIACILADETKRLEVCLAICLKEKRMKRNRREFNGCG